MNDKDEMSCEEKLDLLKSYLSWNELDDLIDSGVTIPGLQSDIHILTHALKSLLNIMEIYGINAGDIYNEILFTHGD